MPGLKDITATTFLESDFKPIVGPDRKPLSYEAWIEIVKRAGTLPSTVPTKIAEAYEPYLGSIIYGWLYWPLLTMGIDKVLALREALARAICEKHNASRKESRTFENCIDFLFAKGLIPQERRGKWDAGRALRNSLAHPDGRTIFMPMDAIVILEAFVQDAAILFPPIPGSP